MEKILEKYIDYGYGFPVVIKNAPMIKVRGVWTLNVNHKILKGKVLAYLATHKGRLTGSHIKFIRLYLEMTLVQFAQFLGVSHPAVLKWEKTLNKPTGMAWSTEKDIRLLAFSKVSKSGKEFLNLYQNLEIGQLEEDAELSVNWG